MSVLEWVGLAVGGALGAGARYLVDDAVTRGRRGAFPLGILLVNVTGSFALGVLVGLGGLIASVWLTIAGVGVLGGYTTFSTVAVDAARLLGRGRADWAWANTLGTLVLCLVAAAVGLALGGLIPR